MRDGRAVHPPPERCHVSETLDRRAFLLRAAALGAAGFVGPSLAGLAACSNGAGPRPRASGYGPLAPSGVPELWVPQGFRVIKVSATRQPSLADPSFTVPMAVDGMAAFPAADGKVRLVRNHEIRDPAATAVPLAGAAVSYDAKAGGGTTTLELEQADDGSVRLVREFVSLSGTHVNCAGGPTPWGSWITCEETVAGPPQGYLQPHGYCFEVPAAADAPAAPVPLKGMGRFVHEAMAVDPDTGIVYLTEDARWDPARSVGAGFYRYLPNERGRLVAGGRLQMLAVADRPNYVTATGQTPGAVLEAAWVDIADPDPAAAATDPAAVFRQGWALGAVAFQRLEGCWYGDGNVYFNATAGGNAGAGQVWAYRPDGDDEGRLTLVFESPGEAVLDAPDNLCVSPRGGLVICEDGGEVQFIRGLTSDGAIFDLVRTAENSTEFAGSCFSPNGRTLFFNIQGGNSATNLAPGGTYALWGPWEEGPL